jgi:hypothetical protein
MGNTQRMESKQKHPIPDDKKSEYERQQAERGRERDSSMAPEQNRPPREQHRGGPLPNQKK